MKTTPSSRIEVLDCCDTTRREFLKMAGVGLAATSVPYFAGEVLAAKKKVAVPETQVAQLYKTLNEKQRKAICFPWDHPLRNRVENNWHITKLAVGDMEDDQIDLVKQIFNGLHSSEYRKSVFDQVVHDSAGGFDDSAIALFGKPGTGKFEFVFTGRHVTRRCDGDSLEGAAFGGPIFYGHAASGGFNEKADHAGNAYWFQAKRPNELFQALDGKQRKTALLGKSRGEHGTKTVALTGKKSGLPGLRTADMSKDQQGLMRKVMADMLAPFRKKDVDESMKLIEKNGFENLHIAYYKDENIGKDEMWDVWQVEGPAMVWYFRGKPHVHTWLHVRESA